MSQRLFFFTLVAFVVAVQASIIYGLVRCAKGQ